MTTIVLCLEGCHGSGKTALTAQFRDMGFTVMDEGFLSQPTTLLHPQSLLMETTWVCGWFQRLMTHIAAMRNSGEVTGNKIIIADRSPHSAIFYTKNDGHLLEPLIRQYVHELKEVADVHIVTVHLRTDRSLLWERIQQRLCREPERAALREDQVDWMDKVLTFYDSLKWDITLRNNETTMFQLVEDVMDELRGVGEALSGVVEAHTPIVKMWRSKSMSTMESPCSSASSLEEATPYGFQVSPAKPLVSLFDSVCDIDISQSETVCERSISDVCGDAASGSVASDITFTFHSSELSSPSEFVTPIKAHAPSMYNTILESPIA